MPKPTEAFEGMDSLMFAINDLTPDQQQELRDISQRINDKTSTDKDLKRLIELFESIGE